MEAPRTHRHWPVVLVLLLIGFSQWTALTKGLWIDEYSTLGLAQSPEFWTRAQTTNTPPTYFLLIKGLLAMGAEEWALRLLSLGFTLAALGLFYFCAVPLVPARWALVGMFWLGTRPTLLYHATEIRPYSLLYLVLAGNLALALRLPPKRSYWLYGSLLLLLCTHAIGILYVPFVLLLRHWRHPTCQRTKWLGVAAFALSGVLLLTFYKPFLQMDWWGDHYLKEGIWAPLYRLLGGNYTLTGLGAMGVLALLPLLRSPQRILVGAILGFPLVLYLVSHGITSIYLQRTLAPLLFVAGLAIVLGAHRLPGQPVVLGIFVLLGADGLLGWDRVNHLPRFNYKAAAQYLDLTSGPKDYLGMNRSDFIKGVGRFYLSPTHGHRIALPRSWDEDLRWSLTQLDRVQNTHARLQVVLPLPEYLSPAAAQILGDLKAKWHYDQTWVGHVQILEFLPHVPKQPPRVKHVFVSRLEDSFEQL